MTPHLRTKLRPSFDHKFKHLIPHNRRSLVLPSQPLPSKSFTQLPNRRLIFIRGPETLHFLQGLVTQNTTNFSRSSPGFYTSFLNAQGRVLHDVFIYKHSESGNEDGCLIEVDAAEVQSLYNHIKRYKLRSKIQARVVDEGEYGIWTAWEEEEGWRKHSITGINGASDSYIGGNGTKDAITLEDMRAPGMGRRIIMPENQKPEIDCEESTEINYRIRRYLKGVPEGQREILKETALPQESCIDYMGGIEYRQGCYVGQELTIRTHHTGVVRKRILPVMVYKSDETAPNKLEYRSGGCDLESLQGVTGIAKVGGKGREKQTGKLLAGVGNLGLALCRLETMTDVAVGGEGIAKDFNKEDEFILKVEHIQDSFAYKVKAFVPPWHLKAAQQT